MLDEDEEKLGELASAIGVMLLCAIAGLLFLSASIWVYDTFL